jgi:hypothetical protein
MAIAQNPRKGMSDPHGDRIKRQNQPIYVLQTGLKNAGFCTVHETGFFDGSTDSALRSFQSQHGMMRHGIATPATLRELHIGTGQPLPRNWDGDDLIQSPLPGVTVPPYRQVHQPPSYPPSTMHISAKGRNFIFYHEARDGSTTGHLHWPGGHSGVSIGPGYDMWQKSKEQIRKDLINVDVSPAKAEQAAAAAHLGGDGALKAKEFAEKNAGLITLSVEQQYRLMDAYLPVQENLVQSCVHA